MGKGRHRRKKKGPTTAERANRYVLYQKAVQSPEADLDFFTASFEEHRSRTPMSLREDFCGTAYFATEWCKSHPERTAIGIDLDRDTLDWGQEHNVDSAGADVSSRVSLVCDNVLTPREEEVDLVCAMNFSYCVFKTRHELRAYFEGVHRSLVEDGAFILELHGGTEGIEELEEEREVEGFTYVWEQERFNPIDAHTLCHIHFKFSDGSTLRRAFTYDWRLWTIPELREVMEEAGFARSVVYWEDVDEDGDGCGEFHITEEEEQQEAWLCYILALK